MKQLNLIKPSRYLDQPVILSDYIPDVIGFALFLLAIYIFTR